MAFLGRVLLNHIRHVPKARILSVAACSWQKLPDVAVAQTRMMTSSLHDGKLNDRCQHTHTHTTVLLLFWNMSGTTRVSRYQKGKTRKVKTNLDLLEQEIVSGSGICWAICKSAPHPRQPRQHHTTQFFTGRMPFLSSNHQRQSTEGVDRCQQCDGSYW